MELVGACWRKRGRGEEGKRGRGEERKRGRAEEGNDNMYIHIYTPI